MANENAPRKPATYACETCNLKYPMGSETTVYLFSKQPWFNHIMTVCPQCRSRWTVWQLHDDAVQYIWDNTIAGNEIVWVIEEFANDELVAKYGRVSGLPLIQPHDLMPRQERMIAFFAYLLAHGEMPDGGPPALGSL